MEKIKEFYSKDKPLCFHYFGEHEHHAHFSAIYNKKINSSEYFGGDEEGAIYVFPKRRIRESIIVHLCGRGVFKQYDHYQTIPISSCVFCEYNPFEDGGNDESLLPLNKTEFCTNKKGEIFFDGEMVGYHVGVSGDDFCDGYGVGGVYGGTWHSVFIYASVSRTYNGVLSHNMPFKMEKGKIYPLNTNDQPEAISIERCLFYRLQWCSTQNLSVDGRDRLTDDDIRNLMQNPKNKLHGIMRKHYLMFSELTRLLHFYK